jgi:hypothetical protein
MPEEVISGIECSWKLPSSDLNQGMVEQDVKQQAGKIFSRIYEHVIQQEHDGHTTLQTWLKRSEKAKRQAEFDIKCNRLQKGLKKPVMTLEHMQAVFMSYLE